MNNGDIINVAEDFSRYPAGRYVSDGPYSGEQFRRLFLMPTLAQQREITIVLDGVRGYGSSFLEEAFGGLVREGYSSEEILSLITIVTSDPSLEFEVHEYIEHADTRDTV